MSPECGKLWAELGLSHAMHVRGFLHSPPFDNRKLSSFMLETELDLELSWGQRDESAHKSTCPQAWSPEPTERKERTSFPRVSSDRLLRSEAYTHRLVFVLFCVVFFKK